MEGRPGWRLLVALMLTGPLGCQTFPAMRMMETATTAPAEEMPAAKKDKDLPPDEAARLCMGTAKQMEQSGAEVPAILLYEKARHDHPKLSGQICRRLAVLYDRQGDFAKALEEYQKALKDNPKDADVLNDLGYSYYNHGQPAEAEKYLRQAVEAKPNHKRAWINLGMVLGVQGRYKESLEAFSKAVSEAQAQCNLAFLLITQGKKDEAKQTYERALQLDPNLAVARVALDKLNNPRPPAPQPAEGGKKPTEGSKKAAKPSAGEETKTTRATPPPAKPTPLPDLSARASAAPTVGFIKLDEESLDGAAAPSWLQRVDYREPARAPAAGLQAPTQASKP